MIKIIFKYNTGDKELHNFKDLDSFLQHYFGDDNINSFEVLEGHSIITGEIQHKGINNN